MADDNKSPIEQALDLFLYAPLGLALTARDNLPALVEKGRQQMTAQVTMAKMVGQFAVGEAERQARKRVDTITENLAARRTPPPAESTAGETRETTDATEATDASAATSTGESAGATAAANGEASAPAEAAHSGNGRASHRDTAPTTPSPSSDHLAIPGYDTLSASQVVQRLAGLSGVELEAVREYEAATRGRRTILTKIAQLQSAS